MQSLTGSSFCSKPAALTAKKQSGCRSPARRQLCCRAEAQKERNLIGVHVNTFTGTWERSDIEYTAKGAQKAGFDLIEGEQLRAAPQHVGVGAWFDQLTIEQGAASSDTK